MDGWMDEEEEDEGSAGMEGKKKMKIWGHKK